MSVCFSCCSTRSSGSYFASIILAQCYEEDKANDLLLCLSCTCSDFMLRCCIGRHDFSGLTFGWCLGLNGWMDIGINEG